MAGKEEVKRPCRGRVDSICAPMYSRAYPFKAFKIPR